MSDPTAAPVPAAAPEVATPSPAPTPAPAGEAPPARRRKRGGRGGRPGAPQAGGDPSGKKGGGGPEAGKRSGKAAGHAPARPLHPLLQRLWELHPQLFGARFRPLKVGIFEDLMARHPGAFAKDELKQALGQHVRSTRYLEAVASGDQRCDLDGQPVEPVAIEHVQHAIVEILRRRQARDPAKARTWARARLVQALDASGLSREAHLERVPTRDALTLELVDEAFAELAEQVARREALVRAFKASGQPVEAFAEMYGLDAALVRDALARMDATPA